MMLNSQNNFLDFTRPFGQRLLIFVLASAASLIICSLLLIPLAQKGTLPAMRVMIMLQDLLIFILPVIVTAILVSRRPADLIGVARGVSWPVFIIALAVLLASMPLMNRIVEWNNSLTLPAGLAQLEAQMRTMEETAEATIRSLMGNYGIGSYIMAVLLVGIMAGVSEELFFRGGIQRLLSTGGVNRHVAIWFTAFVFSAIHMQFFGFVPRLLLGALFGYMLSWSGSVWLPAIIHSINNTLVVSGEFYAHHKGIDSAAMNTFGSGGEAMDILMSCASLVLVVTLLYLLRRVTQQPKENY